MSLRRDGPKLAALFVTLLALTGCDPMSTLLPDTTAPTVSIVSPADAASLTSSTVDVLVDVSDNRAVSSVTASVNGGASFTCSVQGGDRYACGPLSLSLGSNTITVAAVDSSDNVGSDTANVTFASTASEFSIDVRFYDDTFSASQKAAFQEAADIWSSLVIGDVADVPIDVAADFCSGISHPSLSETVEDLLILVTSYVPSDDNILGSAGPCLSRSDGTTPGPKTTVLGLMRFNSNRIDDLETDGLLVDTIVHEMGHVLGIGTNWGAAFGFDLLDFVTGDGSDDCSFASSFSVAPTYTGTSGVSEWFSLGGTGNVPVEESGGSGTQCGHWDEETFSNELMTGFINFGPNPLSALSVASLEDINYVVDTTLADAYSVPTALLAPQGVAYDIASEEMLFQPTGVVDPETGEIVPFD